MATISFPCYSCHQVLKVGGDKAGKKGKCPKCGTLLTIPIASTVQAEAPPAPKPPPAPTPAAYVQPGPVPAGPIHAEPVLDDLPEVPPPRRPRGEEDYYEED